MKGNSNEYEDNDSTVSDKMIIQCLVYNDPKWGGGVIFNIFSQYS